MKKRKKKRYSSQRRQPVNRKHKDRLFQFAFRDKKDLLELYNAVNGTNYENTDDLVITTLEDAVFLGMKNDLSFIIGATMNLYEHQSSWNSNMPLRGLFYFSSLYQTYVEQYGYNLYGSKKIELPFPNYLVFYNGDSRVPDKLEMSLADSFKNPGKDLIPCVDCRVQILNINQGHNLELMERCRRLWEYSEFIGRVKSNLGIGMEIGPAIDRAMNDCREQGILSDILSRCRTEVFRMLLTEYDEKKVRDYLRKEAEEIGGKKAAVRINRLNCLLIAAGQYEELKKASEDMEYQQELLSIYGI